MFHVALRAKCMLLLSLFALTFLPAGAAEKARVWTSADGRKLTGTLEDKGEDWVKIKVKGKVYTLKLEKLSKKDQEFVKGQVIKKPLELKVEVKSWVDTELDLTEKTVEVDFKNIEPQSKVYLLMVWVASMKTDRTTGVKQSVEAFYDRDGTYEHKAGFYNNAKVGEAYRGYALEVYDMEGKLLLERASTEGMKKYLKEASARQKPKPKK